MLGLARGHLTCLCRSELTGELALYLSMLRSGAVEEPLVALAELWPKSVLEDTGVRDQSESWEREPWGKECRD